LAFLASKGLGNLAHDARNAEGQTL